MDGFCVGEPWNAQLVNQGIGYTAFNTGRDLGEASGEVASRMRADWVEQNPNAAKALADGGDGGADVVRRHGQQGGDGRRSSAGAPGSTCRPRDIVDRLQGRDTTTATAASSTNSPHLMKFWRDHASYPFQSHELWFLTEDIRWGKLAPDDRHQGADREGQPRGHLARGGEGARRRGGGHPGLDLARAGDLLRRQGLRSRRTRQPTSPASPSSASPEPQRSHGELPMPITALKIDVARSPRRRQASRRSSPCRSAQREPISAAPGELAGRSAERVVPPLVTLAVLLARLAAHLQPARLAPLPPPTPGRRRHLGADRRSVLRRRRPRQGPVLAGPRQPAARRARLRARGRASASRSAC